MKIIFALIIGALTIGSMGHVGCLWVWAIPSAFAQETQPIILTIENHIFHPTEIHIPANQRAEILVKNLDPTAEEFESGALSIEKVVAGKSESIVRIRPTGHGHYTFVGEYHEKTARGVLIAD